MKNNTAFKIYSYTLMLISIMSILISISSHDYSVTICWFIILIYQSYIYYIHDIKKNPIDAIKFSKFVTDKGLVFHEGFWVTRHGIEFQDRYFEKEVIEMYLKQENKQ